MPEVRLIDANELKRLIQSGDDLIFDAATERELLYMIDYQPTIEAEPVRRGHWKGWTTPRWTGKYNDNGDPEYIDYIYYTCSRCYRKSVVRELYCPKCGAKMDLRTPTEVQLDEADNVMMGGADNG